MSKMSRRDMTKTAAAAAALTAASAIRPAGAQPAPRLKFAAIGLNHGHIYAQCDSLIAGGGELVSFLAIEDDLAAEFQERYPNARRVRDERRILEDRNIKVVVSASIPNQRAPLGVRVMRAGKDFVADKPGATSLEQLEEVRRVQAETGRIYSITYSERFQNKATVRAGDLVRAGAIGDVVQTTGQGPHRVNPPSRPDWFWDTANYGGIITDIASHQFDQFLYFTNSTRAEIVASQVGNFHHRDHPKFEDFGDVIIRGDGGTGYIRVDWFTPAGLGVWGDGRLTIVGSEGYIELRKYIDIAGREGANHLFLVDRTGIQHMDCNSVELPYGRQVIDDVLNRTETAMSQAHCFLAMELAIRAQMGASRADRLSTQAG
jgi:predicted dehydrogenase